MISVQSASMASLMQKIELLESEIENAAYEAIMGGGDCIAEEARRRVRVQRRSGPKGESPLADSIELVEDRQELGVKVVALAPYARFVEFGTRRMAARPFMHPAALGVKNQIVNIVMAAVRKALKGGI